MKRAICILLLCALALLCVGCGGSAGAKLREETDDAMRQARDLLERIGAEDMLDELRALAAESGAYTDAELEQELRRIAAEKGLQLGDGVAGQLVRLMRGVEKGADLKNRVDTARDKVGDAAKSVRDVFRK